MTINLQPKKMAEVREVRAFVEEAKSIQKGSVSRIDDLFKKLAEVKEYAGKLQLQDCQMI